MTQPIDDAPLPPGPSGRDADYLTRDLTSALERAVLARVVAVAQAQGIGRRAAALIVLQEIQQR